MNPWKFFVGLGLLFIALGGVFWVGEKFPFFNILGRLPGDIRIERKNFTFYFPLATSILLSLLVTIILTLIGRLRK